MSNILANTKIESQNNTYRFLENVRLGGDTNSSVREETNREIYESNDVRQQFNIHPQIIQSPLSPNSLESLKSPKSPIFNPLKQTQPEPFSDNSYFKEIEQNYNAAPSPPQPDDDEILTAFA